MTKLYNIIDTFFYVVVWKCGSEKEETTASSRRSGLGQITMKQKQLNQKLLYAITRSDYDIQEQQCHECPEDSGAAFVERRDNFPRRVFYDLNNAIGVNNGIMDNALTPSVAVGYAVAIDNALTIHGVRPLPLTLENTIARVNTIAVLRCVGLRCIV